MDRGFDTAVANPINLEQRNDDSERIVNDALVWLRDRSAAGDTRPAFLYLHVLQPHNPYLPSAAHRGNVPVAKTMSIDGRTSTLLKVSHGRRPLSPAEIEELRALYLANFLEALEHYQRLMQAIQEFAEPHETLAVATSDHGEEILEHGSALHGYQLYQEMIHIPMLLSRPGHIPAGSTEALTDTTDVYCFLRHQVWPTDLACRIQHLVTGVPVDPKVVYSAAASVKGGIFAAQTKDLKAIVAPQRGRRWGMGTGPGRTWDTEFGFDLAADPLETTNLLAAGLPASSQERFWPTLISLYSWMNKGPGHNASRESTTISAEAKERLERLGYVN